MKFLILFLFLILFVPIGCSAINAKKLESGIVAYSDVVSKICSTSELFEVIDKPTPVRDVCEKVVKVDNLIKAGDISAAVDTVTCIKKAETIVESCSESAGVRKCIDNNIIDIVELKTCIKDNPWISLVTEQIAKRVEKQRE